MSIEEQNVIQAMAASANADKAEEERLLQMALQASTEEETAFFDPDNPDVDNMTYE